MEPLRFNVAEIQSLISITNPNKMAEIGPNDNLICYLAKSMLDWTEEQQQEALFSIENKKTTSPYYKLLIDIYQADKHIEITGSHREFLMKTYNRLKVHFPAVTEKQLDDHDKSKLNFIQIVGYTKRFIHMCSWEDEIWQKALRDHYLREGHHPEHSSKENMPRQYLEESVIDMLACHWERDLYGKIDVSNYEMADIDKKYLNRYTADDRKEAMKILKNIKTDDISK